MRGPICRQIGAGPNPPGPNMPGPNLPRTSPIIDRANGHCRNGIFSAEVENPTRQPLDYDLILNLPNYAKLCCSAMFNVGPSLLFSLHWLLPVLLLLYFMFYISYSAMCNVGSGLLFSLHWILPVLLFL